MTESTDRTYDMLQRVGEFLKKLTADQYAALVSGDARIDVVPKGARIVGPATKRPAAPVELPLPADRIVADLQAIGDRDAAAGYLDDLRLKRPQIVLLAGQLGIRVTTKNTIPQIRDLIVEDKVGHRLATNAILGRSSAAS